jgi:hypothetical protein
LSIFEPAVCNVKKQTPCRIKINGEYIKVPSGKTLWKCKAHARLAVKTHFGYMFGQELQKFYPQLATVLGPFGEYYIPDKVETECYDEFIEYVQSQGILEFVELSY